MEREAWEEKLIEAFALYTAHHPDAAIALISGMLVGLLEKAIGEDAFNSGRPIKLDIGSSKELVLRNSGVVRSNLIN